VDDEVVKSFKAREYTTYKYLSTYVRSIILLSEIHADEEALRAFPFAFAVERQDC